MTYEFKLPDVGEGLTEGEVVKWHVKEGDSVKENQPLVNVLTDKAEVEIPSPKSGKILKLMAKEGQKVPVGGVLVSFEIDGGGSSVSTASAATSKGVLAGIASHAPAAGSTTSPAAHGSVATGVSATPAVRKLAADLKVDLASVHGTGPGGRVTEADVRQAADGGHKPVYVSPELATLSTHVPQKESATSSAEKLLRPEERVAFSGIRRKTAEKMALSKRTIPHVTHMDEADCGGLINLRNEMKPEAEKKGIKLTYLSFIIKALVKSLKEFPNLNASLDEEKQEIVRKKYYNIGMATATEHGLYVPVIKSADAKNIWQIAEEIERLAEKARVNKLEIADLQGGTFTVTNVGPIGGLFATPIIVHPEAGILGVMKMGERPVARDGQVVVRPIMNLVLSFDHRILDGAEAASFMNTLVRHIENPRTAL